MDPALSILERLVDGRPEASMGSEYSRAGRYLARVDERRARDSDAESHGANQSDFGAERLGAD